MTFDIKKIDIDSLVPETQGNPLRSTMSEAMKVNPESQIKLKKLSRDSGMPMDAVETDIASVESSLNLNKIDFDAMSKRNPHTSKYLTDFNNASIAHPDVDPLTRIEDIFSGIKEYGVDVSEAFKRGGAMVESSEIGVSKMWSALGTGEPITDEQAERLKALESEMQAKDEYGFIAGIPMAASEQLPILWEILTKGAGYAAIGAAPGLATAAIPGAAPVALPLAVAGAKLGGRLGVAKAAFDLEAGLAFNEFSVLTDGSGNTLDPKIAGYAAATVGAINAGLESISIMALGRTVTPAVRAVVKSRIKRALMTETGREAMKRIALAYTAAVTTESVTEGLQEFTNILGAEFAKFADEDAFTEQNISTALDNVLNSAERIVGAAKKGAQASILLSAPGTAVSVITENKRKKQLAENEQAQINDLNAAVTDPEFKLNKLDKESFREFMQGASENADVFLDGEQVAIYLQEKTPEEIQADPALQLLQKKVDEAAALKGDVTVPVADFATDVVGTDHYDTLRPHMKLSPETSTPFRQEQDQKAGEDYIKTLINEAQESGSTYAESQDIFETVRDQLIDTGRMTPQQASVMADIVPAWATVQSQSRGIPVKQVYEESGLRTVGPLTGEAARLLEEGALEQAQDSGFKGEIRTEASEWNRAVEKGLDMSQEGRMARAEEMGFDTEKLMFHGSRDKGIQAFDLGKAGAGVVGSATRNAVFFTSEKENAVFYTDPIEIEGGEILLNIDDIQTYGEENEYALIGDDISIGPFSNENEAYNAAEKIVEKNNKLYEAGETDVIHEVTADELIYSTYLKMDNPLIVEGKHVPTVVKQAQEGGYDGAIIKDVLDGDTYSDIHVVFDPSQIRSVNAAFDPDFKETGILLAQEPVIKAPTFFSKLRSVITEKMQKRAPGQDVINLIKKEGVKAEEIKWSGVEEFLKEKKTATKDEVLEFLEANRIEVTEVEKKVAEEPSEIMRERTAAHNAVKEYAEDQGYLFDDRGVDEYSYIINEETNETVAEGYITDIAGDLDLDLEVEPEPIGGTKFSDYTLPGGENYKELLLTLPEVPGEPIFVKKEHFDEPNILAHVRFNERTDAEGNRVLFLEEVQSDWNLEARKKGVGEPFSEAKKKELAEITSERKQIYKEAGVDTSDHTDAGLDAMLKLNFENKRMFELIRRERALIIEQDASAKGVPAAPFIQKNWHELALKRMLRYAAENNFDKVAWITGQQTADRYDLSKKINSVASGRRTDGRYSLQITGKQGTIIDDRIVDNSDMESFLGKELSKKIQENEDVNAGIITTFSGLDLKIGGEWAFTLYDKVIPNFLKKYGKKWGAKVESVEIDSDTTDVADDFTAQSIPITSEMKQAVLEVGQPLFQEAKGYYDPANSLIRLTESSNLSTFLHEFAHFMYDMELKNPESKMTEKIHKWFKRNAESVAEDANGYVGRAGALGQADVEAFDSWFGDSKVVDENGDPLVVYHGSPVEFEAFDPQKMGEGHDVEGAGFYFTNSRDEAEVYRHGDQRLTSVVKAKGIVYETYLRIENPVPLEGEINRDEIERIVLNSIGLDSIEQIDEWFETDEDAFWESPLSNWDENPVSAFYGAVDAIMLSENPHDAFQTVWYDIFNADNAAYMDAMLELGYDGVIIPSEKQHAGNDHFLVFNPTAIKSTDSVAFDLTDPRIKFQDGVPPVTPGNITAADVTAYLDTGTSGNVAKDNAIERAVHEQFARGFETYLMEGKAPSMEMRNVFRTIARWLVQIYKSIQGDLKVNLDDEMRQVFDRLIATEEQINAAEARAQFEPMFTDAAMAGMTDEEFEKYKERQGKTKDKASETLRDKMIKQLTRQTEKWWKEEKADIIDEEIERLKTEKVYVAKDTLLTGEFKLDRKTVKEMAGVERTDTMGRKTIRPPEALRNMTAPGSEGVHPDEAAGFLGYNSGDEMIQALIDAPNIKVKAAENAEQIMLERHGDIMNDGTIEKEADEAVQNEERGELILAELKALSKGTGRAVIERQMLKTMAEENIGKLSFRNIHPGKYRKAEIRAAQEAAVALAAGNKEEAATAKARQALNFYLGKAATEAKTDTMKIVDRMARYKKKSIREAIMKAEGGYWEQLTKILTRFEFRKGATLGQVDRLNVNIAEWAKARIEEDGDGLILTPEILDERYVTHWKNVPYDALQGVNDSVKNIEHVAKYSNKITHQQEEMDFKKLVQKWTDSMNEKVKTRFKTQRTDVIEGKKWGRWAMAQMTKIPYMASWLDGQERAGISHDILVQPFTDAYNEELQLWDEVGSVVMNAIQGRSKEDLKRHNQKIFIPEIKDEDNDGNLYGHQVLAVALNTGNEGNLTKMLLGEGWANPDVEAEISIENPRLQAILAHLTKSDMDLVQLVWDQMDQLYPRLAEVHRKTTGLTPPKIEATPVVFPFGTYKGGYYPVKYDPNRSIKAQLNEDRLNAETESMFGRVGIQASVNASATNERTGYYAPIRLSLDVVPNHFQETIHYITHHDSIRQINKLIKNESVANTIKEKLGPEEYAQLRPWLNDIAKDGREAPLKSFIGSMLQRLRFGTTLGVMGFKASTGLIQILGLSNTIAEVGSAPVYQAIRSILGSTTTMQTAWDFAVDNSKVMSHRVNTMDREIKNAMQKLTTQTDIKTGNFMRDVFNKIDNFPFLKAMQETSMKHIALMQTYMVDLPSWHAAYIKGMKDWGDEKRSYAYADWVIENIQGSGVTKDMAQIMRDQNQGMRMFTMFMTFFSSLWNQERDLIKGAKAGTYSRTTVAAKLMFLFAVPVFLEMLMRGEFGDDDDDESNTQKYLTNLALYPVQSVPGLRDIASASVGEYGYNISPIAQVIESGTKSIPELMTRPFTDEEITKGQVKGATKFVGAAVGIPGINQAWATGEHLYDVLSEGEELTLNQLLYGPRR